MEERVLGGNVWTHFSTLPYVWLSSREISETVKTVAPDGRSFQCHEETRTIQRGVQVDEIVSVDGPCNVHFDVEVKPVDPDDLEKYDITWILRQNCNILFCTVDDSVIRNLSETYLNESITAWTEFCRIWSDG